MKILIRATNWLGDAVMSLPAIRAVRARYPEAEITVLAKPWVAALYENEAAINRVLVLHGLSGARDWASKLIVASQLREENFDLAVLLPNSFESAAVARLAGIREIVGYSRDGRGWLLHHAVKPPLPGEIPSHEGFYYLELIRRSGMLESLPPTLPDIRFDGIEKSHRNGKELFSLMGVGLPVIGVSPGAAFGSAKRWLPERFAEAASQLSARLGASIAVFGSEGEKHLCAQVADACGGKNFAGTTALRAFIDMASVCSVFLSNDSGAMHIAAALGVPSATVFGPTNEVATGPTGSLAAIVREKVDCSPCMKRECPIDHRCMTRVQVDQVVFSALEAVSRRGTGSGHGPERC